VLFNGWYLLMGYARLVIGVLFSSYVGVVWLLMLVCCLTFVVYANPIPIPRLYSYLLPPTLYKNSLHALLTNIKWDFNNTNQLAGEVSIPNKAIHQRFCLDKNELSEFDISNKLWKMIEG